MEEEKPSYYAIIPASVRYDDNLKLGEKMMYGEITALSNKTGTCYASNNYFARLYKVSPQAISKWIKALENNKYITISYEKNGEAITKRVIEMVSIDIDRVSTTVDRGINSSLGGYQQEIKENNININNTSINNKKEIYKESNFKEEFEELWKLYPKKVGKKKALDYYIKARKDKVPFDKIKQGIENYNEYIKETKTKMQYVKDGSTWFNQHCWEDERKVEKVKTHEQEIEEMKERLKYLDEGD